MDHVATRGWVTCTVWLLAASAHAQGGELSDTMGKGLVPLFGAIGAGILFMATLTAIAVFWLRPRLPRLEA